MSFFDKIDLSSTLGHIRDTMGIKFCDVYFLIKRKGQPDQLTPFLPSPLVDYISLQQQVDSGGTISVGDVLLKQIPVSRYSEGDLETATSDENLRKYWVLKPTKSSPKAFKTAKITRGQLFWQVLLERYKSINESDLIKILP